MQRHTSELYRLAELPAFIEEALSNVSLKKIIVAYRANNHLAVLEAIDRAVIEYAEEFVDTYMNSGRVFYLDHPDDPEIQAIDAGVKLFSNPDCKAGLPE